MPHVYSLMNPWTWRDTLLMTATSSKQDTQPKPKLKQSMQDAVQRLTQLLVAEKKKVDSLHESVDAMKEAHAKEVASLEQRLRELEAGSCSFRSEQPAASSQPCCMATDTSAHPDHVHEQQRLTSLEIDLKVLSHKYQRMLADKLAAEERALQSEAAACDLQHRLQEAQEQAAQVTSAAQQGEVALSKAQTEAQELVHLAKYYKQQAEEAVQAYHQLQKKVARDGRGALPAGGGNVHVPGLWESDTSMSDSPIKAAVSLQFALDSKLASMAL